MKGILWFDDTPFTDTVQIFCNLLLKIVVSRSDWLLLVFSEMQLEGTVI